MWSWRCHRKVCSVNISDDAVLAVHHIISFHVFKNKLYQTDYSLPGVNIIGIAAKTTDNNNDGILLLSLVEGLSTTNERIR